MAKYTRGSTVYPEFEVFDTRHTSVADATLDGTVEFSIDEGATWAAGEWDGEAYLAYNRTERMSLPTRIARRSTTLAITDGTASPLPVWVRVTDGGEVILIKGTATIQ